MAELGENWENVVKVDKNKQMEKNYRSCKSVDSWANVMKGEKGNYNQNS